MEALVIGCGVSGLSTAICLQEAGWRVTIWTATLPPDTTSSVAAAIWYPYKAYPEHLVVGWSKFTYAVFETFARNPTTGVIMRENVEVSRTPLPDPWWSSAVPDLRRLTAAELPAGYVDALAFTTPVIEMPVYLRYLMDRFTRAGGTVDIRLVSSLAEATEIYPVIFNCTGLGSHSLLHDAQMAPIRGQVVRVANPGIERAWLDEEHPDGMVYIVPRANDCILGGTAIEGVWDMTPDPATAEAILRRCIGLEPRLAEAPILEHKVGLRPGRTTIRLEREEFPNGTCCIHNYGHGGAGVTLSWGCAAEAVQLVG
ncbi:MAG TPA: FAD-dependent oxidoreductase [Herpetosiphonaceae bacterium]